MCSSLYFVGVRIICAAKDFCINVFAGVLFGAFVEVMLQGTLSLISFCKLLFAVAEDWSS